MEHWDGVRPGSTEPYPIVLPKLGSLADDDCYVPAGFFWSGTEGESTVPLPIRRLWCDPFVMKRYPVTNAEYVEFLNALVRDGREEEALDRAPQLPGGKLVYGRDDAGRFTLGRDSSGHEWTPEMPAVLLRWDDAVAFAAFRATESEPWRLPVELEWSKAARGVDRRHFPWGNFSETTWSRIVFSGRDRVGPTEVSTYPIDESAYRVRHTAGQAMNWLADPFPNGGGETEGVVRTGVAFEQLDTKRLLRGASWNMPAHYSSLWQRRSAPSTVRYDAHGARLCRAFRDC